MLTDHHGVDGDNLGYAGGTEESVVEVPNARLHQTVVDPRHSLLGGVKILTELGQPLLLWLTAGHRLLPEQRRQEPEQEGHQELEGRVSSLPTSLLIFTKDVQTNRFRATTVGLVKKLLSLEMSTSSRSVSSALVTAGPLHSKRPAVIQAMLMTRNWEVSRTTENETVFLLWTCSHTDWKVTSLNWPNIPSTTWLSCLLWPSHVTMSTQLAAINGNGVSLFIGLTVSLTPASDWTRVVTNVSLYQCNGLRLARDGW